MVVTTKNKVFEESRKLFKKGDIASTLSNFEKSISSIDEFVNKGTYIDFLKEILEYCRENKLKEEEAIALRVLGRTLSVFKEFVESLKYHEASLRIQRKLGKKIDIAEGLLFLAEDLEVSGNYERCISAYHGAEVMFHELGKLQRVLQVKKELNRLKDFSKQMIEDEYYLQKLNLDY